jgi:NAD(P)-dependent dehydrogenase (short-subunit alcohol dehydrogenase family)
VLWLDSACYAIIAALISKRYLIFSSVSVNSAANSAFGASKAELAGTSRYLQVQKVELAGTRQYQR